MAYNPYIQAPTPEFAERPDSMFRLPAVDLPAPPRNPKSIFNLKGGLDDRGRVTNDTRTHIGGGPKAPLLPNQVVDTILALQQAKLGGMTGLPTGPERIGGGTGGGSEVMASDPMSANALVSQNLNPYLTQNVHSFRYGGKMRDPYNYGGRVPRYQYGGATHTMPDGTVHPGATHEDYMAMMDQSGGGHGHSPNELAMMEDMYAGESLEYKHGGFFTKRANEAIALNQLAKLGNKMMARKGMKYDYEEGGNYPHNMYDPETGYKIVAQNEGMHNKLDAKGFTHSPKAAYGMKMKKKRRYTQGGRF